MRVLPGLQHKLSVAQVPYEILLQAFPYGLHGDNLESSCRHVNVSLVSIRHPISGPQHILGPKHVPIPFAHLLH